MIQYHNPAPFDVLYLKFKQKKEIWSEGLAEFFDGSIDKEQIDVGSFVFSKEEAKPDSKDVYKYSRDDFVKKLNELLTPYEVEDFAILPEGETTNAQLTDLLSKYNLL